MSFDRRVCILAAKDKHGKILLQLRGPEAKARRGCWAFFGGHIHDGETPEETLLREGREELGITLTDYRFLRRYEQMEDAGRYEKFLFLWTTTLTAGELKERLREGKDVGLFSKDELTQLKIDERDREIIEEVLRA